MGYLDSSVVAIDAILTKKGREILSRDPSAFSITKFALSDDEVDYRLWNPDHSLGSDYYGEVIENMPILEASPNENQMLKFKLITLDKESTAVPTVTLSTTYVELLSVRNGIGESHIIIPTTINVTDGNSKLGYTAILSDSSIATLHSVPGYEVHDAATDEAWASGTYTGPVGDAGSTTIIARRFELRPKSVRTSNYGTVTIIGNETGGRVVLQFKQMAVNSYGIK